VLHDLVTKAVRELDTVTAEDFFTISVHGNFLSASNQEEEYVWDLKAEQLEQKFATTLQTSGLSPDGGDIVLVHPAEDGSFGVAKICHDLKHYYVPEVDDCGACIAPCDQCFLEGNRCSSCNERYFLKNDFSCGACSQGCLGCASEDLCTKCDNANHWTAAGDVCICATTFILDESACKACSSLINGCSQCSSKAICTTCSDGFTLNPDSKQCDEDSDHTLIIIIIIVVVVVIVAIVGIIIWRRRTARKNKSTVLDSEPLEDYEKVEDN
jgi:hypothetical protein